MPDLTAIAAALSSFKAAKDIAEAMIGLRDTAAFQSKLIEFQSKLLDANNAAFAAQDERSDLLARIRELETENIRLQEWDTQKRRYQLIELPPGVFVLSLKPEVAAGEPHHSICQTCYQRGKKSILHSDAPANGVHHLTCYECNTRLRIGRFIPPRQGVSSQGWT